MTFFQNPSILIPDYFRVRNKLGFSDEKENLKFLFYSNELMIVS